MNVDKMTAFLRTLEADGVMVCHPSNEVEVLRLMATQGMADKVRARFTCPPGCLYVMSGREFERQDEVNRNWKYRGDRA